MKPVHEAEESVSAAALGSACTALWSATLSLMVAYMHNRAPAHRYLIARRIARNFGTLHEQHCFTGECRARFARLACHWNENADQLARQERHPRGGIGVLLPNPFNR